MVRFDAACMVRFDAACCRTRQTGLLNDRLAIAVDRLAIALDRLAFAVDHCATSRLRPLHGHAEVLEVLAPRGAAVFETPLA